MPDVTTHLCPRCAQVKSVAEFAGRKNSAGLPYRSSYCRACQAEYNRAWREAHGAEQNAKRKAKYRADPDMRARAREASALRYAADPAAMRNTNLIQKFGITLAEYQRMFDAQSGLCRICGEACKSGRSLAVDHDHATGRVRGLLCIRCNNGLGNFRDAPDILTAAIEYLKEGTSEMPTHYVEDYEALTGKKIPADVEVKVVGAPPAPEKASKTQAETK